MGRVVLPRARVARLDQLDVSPPRCDAPRGLCLESVQHVNRSAQLQRVHRPLRIAVKILDDLDEATEFAFEALGVERMLPALGDVERVPDVVLDRLGKVAEVFASGAHPLDRRQGWSIDHGRNMLVLACVRKRPGEHLDMRALVGGVVLS